MTIEDLLSICKDFKDVTTDIKWDDHVCFNSCSASFKVSEEDFATLTEKDGLSQAHYFAKLNKCTFYD